MRRFLIVMGLLLLTASPANAHTAIVSTSPEQGATLQTVPTQVVISTDDVVQEMGTRISVIGPSGTQVDDGSTEVDGKTVLVGLPQLTEAGTYTVNYRLIAQDGHGLLGSYTFTLATTPTATSPAPSPTASETTTPTPSGSKSGMWITLAAVAVALTSLALLIRRLRR